MWNKTYLTPETMSSYDKQTYINAIKQRHCGAPLFKAWLNKYITKKARWLRIQTLKPIYPISLFNIHHVNGSPAERVL